MMYRVFGALVASLSVAAVVFASNPASARSGAAAGGRFVASHPAFRPSPAHAFRHRGRGGFLFGPGLYGYDYGAATGEPLVDTTPSPPADVHYTYTYDVPWDWAHRYPPRVLPSDRPYVPGCSDEATTFPGRDGRDRTVNITRCY